MGYSKGLRYLSSTQVRRCSLFPFPLHSLPLSTAYARTTTLTTIRNSNKIPKAKIRDPYSIELYLDVNGETRQRDLTGLMLSRIPRIIGAISRVMTLERGDLILTGTPKGVGPVFPGDTLTAGLRVDGQEIEEGRIEVEVKEREGGV